MKPFSEKRRFHLDVVRNVGAFHFTGNPIGFARTADSTVADRKGVYTDFYESLMCLDAPEYICTGVKSAAGILINLTVNRGEPLL